MNHMLPRLIRLGALAAILLTAAAGESQACNWFGGGWGAFRPLTWGSYRPWTSNYGGGYWGSAVNCCPSPCNPCGSGCSACGTASYSGGSGCSSCASGDSYSSGYSPPTEPQPDPAGSTGTDRTPAGPETDDFRGSEYGTERDIRSNSNRSSIPPEPPSTRSSIPQTPPSERSSIPMNPPENRSSIPMNPPTGGNAPAGDDAPMWRTPAPQEPSSDDVTPITPPTGSEVLRVPPLDLGQPVASTYHVQRQRVPARAVYQTPAVARTVVGPNDGWTPVGDGSRVASSR